VITDTQHSVQGSKEGLKEGPQEGPFVVSEGPRSVRRLTVGGKECVTNVPTSEVYRSILTDYHQGDDFVGSKLIEALSEGFCTCEYPEIGGLSKDRVMRIGGETAVEFFCKVVTSEKPKSIKRPASSAHDD